MLYSSTYFKMLTKTWIPNKELKKKVFQKRNEFFYVYFIHEKIYSH